jgi:hypothetical protein
MRSSVRTTLTLDDDFAALLERVRSSRRLGLKEAVNEALRQGLTQMAAPPARREYRARGRDRGRCLIGRLDDVAGVLAIAEGEDFR